MERLVIYLIFLYLMSKLILSAVEQEKWWLVLSLVISTFGAIFYYYTE